MNVSPLRRSPLLLLALPALLASVACGSQPDAQDGVWNPVLTFDAAKTCHGDELQYDSNAFAASLAVATANELGRWDALGDFELRDGKLELSAMGELHCGAGCTNIRALLRLQDDAASAVPNHEPLRYRNLLSSWYQEQQAALTQLVDSQLRVDKGIYRLRNRQSAKYLQIDLGSMDNGAVAEQHALPSQPGSDEWRVLLDHGSHQLINVRSGKCLSLNEDSASDDVAISQQTCSPQSPLQRFAFATVDQYYSLRTKTGLSLRVKDAGLAEDVPIVQFTWSSGNLSEQWSLEPVGADTLPPDLIADGMYALVAQNSNKAVTFDHAGAAEQALIQQREYVSSDDSFHWYAQRVPDTGGALSAGKKYRFINRQSGQCLDLEAASAGGRLVQRTCSDAETQLFMTITTGDGSNVLYSLYGRSIEIEGASAEDGAALAQGNDASWASHRQFLLTPVLAGAPARASFSHASSDGPCGDQFWYDITQPNGQPLGDPGNSFVQLIFAGGRTSAAGAGENPFLSQPSSGQVAIDPSAHLLPGAALMSSCIDSAVLFDPTGAAQGRCCRDADGSPGTLIQSSWSPTTYLCQ
ncbi:MAG TPA: RICIN domain-containing protein [Polyangiaceae bacterium]|nr:RICIN domain-containing protein [Polyangiaceae bacterium]